MAVDTPTPLVTPEQLAAGAFADLVRSFDAQALADICDEASRACETEVTRRFMPFTVTESHRAEGVDPDELGAMSGAVVLDLYASLGMSYANALGGGGGGVRRVWLREYAAAFPEMWQYTGVACSVTLSIGGTTPITPMAGPVPDSGLVWFPIGTYAPVGSLLQVTYSGGYATIPADLRRAAKWMAAAICVRELDPVSAAQTGHDASNLESLATAWLSPYQRS
jgi:hypothetical protein